MNSGRFGSTRGTIVAFVFLALQVIPSFASGLDYPDIRVKNILGEEVPLNTYSGKVLLVANTASLCGYTPQYKDLEEVYRAYKEKGLVVLGFPSNDFGGQEPESNRDIKTFCETRFNVSFPLFAKGPVSGEQIQPLFKYLTTSGTDSLKGPIGWNFEKFLLDRSGVVRARFGSYVNPQNKRVKQKIEELLAE